MTPEVEAEIRQFVKERDEILMAGDIDRFIAFLKKRNPGIRFSTREVAEISLHEVRTAAKSLPMEYRIESKKWLNERGYTSMDDGDIKRDQSATVEELINEILTLTGVEEQICNCARVAPPLALKEALMGIIHALEGQQEP